LFDPARNSFTLYTEKGGLSTEFIKGITEDEKGNLWISTSNGLTKLNPETKEYKKYNTSDGLQGLEFEANAYLKTRDGQMFFGGVNGFNSFDPEQIRFNHFVPPVYITGFQVFYKTMTPGEKNSPLKSDISLTKELKLSYKQSTLSFGFTALNFTASENNQYAYKLEGLDNEWIYTGTERKATYTNLAPGTYTFKVKASNNDGIWNQEGTAISIIITPPFWQTWWFTTLLILGIMAGIFALFGWRRRLELRKLEEKKKEEMHQMQLQFFTNISHDFRTPLTLILGPLEKLKKEDTQSAFSHYYKMMHRNALKLLSLVNELMDYRKTASGALKLNVMPGNLNLFLNEIAEEFSGMAEEKQAKFSLLIPENLPTVWFDRQVLEKIVTNLVSNAFKFSPDGGNIDVEVLTSLKAFKPSFKNELILKSNYKGKQYMFIRIADNGMGISKESMNHLFERYYRINDTIMGSGIGLAFVKTLTFLHKGNIYVYSEQHKGTEIIIGLPVSKTDYRKEERWKSGQGPGLQLESVQWKQELHVPFEEDTNVPVKVPGKRVQNKPYILVVEDNDELRSFVKNSLQPLYNISEARNGAEGLAKAGEEAPDLIISDVMMPGMNGIEFCKHIKENIQTSHIPFLMLTAKDALESKIEGAESGADYYFTKPISIDLLLLNLRNIFEQGQKLKERYLKDHQTGAIELAHSSKDKAFIDQLLTIIESQLSNPEMDVEYICTQMGMSKTKLYQKLKGITGQSIGEFVRTTRLKKAVQIMSEEDVSLTDVMYRVGIQTQSYFTKAFKKEFGKTPSQFLQEMKTNAHV
jgi:signal transduction histidine kinase/DNA-binding response OmpR family regulator